MSISQLDNLSSVKQKLTKLIQETKAASLQKNKFVEARGVNYHQRSIEKDKGGGRGNRKKRTRRLKMLRGIPTFKKFTPKQLDLILDHAKPMKIESGEAIIKQGDVGEEFFLVEEGEAIVSRKVNIHNADEVPTELVRLKAPVAIGERAIETAETRNATVTASSEGLLVLKIMKDEYNKIRELNRELVTERALEIIRSIEPFNALAESQLASIARDMQIHHYPKQTYICEQGQQGHTFYIILSGRCLVTVNHHNPETGEDFEKEINTMFADQFFGEVALMDQHQRRTANVITIGDVSVLALRRRRFEELMRIGGVTIKEQLMKEVAIRNMTVVNSSDERDGNWFAVESEWKNVQKRHMRTGRFPTKFEVAGRRMVLSLQYTLYKLCWQGMARLFNRGELVRLRHFGSFCEGIGQLKTPATACYRLRLQVRAALKSDRSTRSADELGLIHGVTYQILKTEKDGICRSWANHQYADLCSHMRGHYYTASEQIIEAGEPIKDLFIILRGIVAIYDSKDLGQRSSADTDMSDEKQQATHRTSRGTFLKILRPGLLFGGNQLATKDLMAPNALRQIRTLRAFALTDVDVISFDVRTFTSIKLAAKADISYDEKMKVMNSVPLFREIGVQKLATIGVILKTEEVNRGSAIILPGKTTDRLYFVLSGFVDVTVANFTTNSFACNKIYEKINKVKESKSNTSQVVGSMHVTTLGVGEYFGESGVMTFLNKKPYTESTTSIAKSHVKLLTLHKQHYAILTIDILRSIQKNYRLRASWRGARLIEAQKAKHEMEAAIANAAGNPELPPHLEGTESSDILSHHYRKAIEASQIRPRHLRKAVNAEMKKTATYDSSMINVFEMREMGLDKILDSSGRDLNKSLIATTKMNRTRSYQNQMAGMRAMTPMSLSEPSFRSRPVHWFSSETKPSKDFYRGKHPQYTMQRAMTSIGTSRNDLRPRLRSESFVSSMTVASRAP